MPKWACAYCGRPNADERDGCSSCGAPRPKVKVARSSTRTWQSYGIRNDFGYYDWWLGTSEEDAAARRLYYLGQAKQRREQQAKQRREQQAEQAARSALAEQAKINREPISYQDYHRPHPHARSNFLEDNLHLISGIVVILSVILIMLILSGVIR